MHLHKTVLIYLFLLISNFVIAQVDTTSTVQEAPDLITSSNEVGLDERINQAFTPFANFIESVVLYSFRAFDTDIPLIVIVLSLGGLFFSFYFGFPSIRKFGLAIRVVQGKYDDIENADTPEIKTNNLNTGISIPVFR